MEKIKFYKILFLPDKSVLSNVEGYIKDKILEAIKNGEKRIKIEGEEYEILNCKDFLKTDKFYLFFPKDRKKPDRDFVLNEFTSLLLENYLKEKEEYTKKIELLEKAGEFFASSIEIETIIRNIIYEVKKVLDVERVSIFKVDEEKKKISFFSFTEGEEILKMIEVDWGKGIVGDVAVNKRPLIVNDVREDRRFNPKVDKMTGFKTKNILAYPLIVQKRVIGVIEAINKLNGGFTEDDLEIVALISSPASISLQNAFLYAELENLFKGTILSLANAVEAKDPYTSGHVERIATLSTELARKYGLKGEDLKNAELAGILHDIGKIAVPDDILKKPGGLTDEEYEIIKAHVYHGARILSPIPGLKKVIPAVLHHHERWDGKGYPMGLKGKEIPILARIVTITDSFDAMNSDRPYRKKLEPDDIIKEFRKNKGKQFDPELVELFLELDELKELLNK